jgi:hypothetical protein
MAQNTNLNASPYFDDFDPTKNYQRVLFKPGIPIQARELTTVQSILQNQIEKFGKHFFKEGQVVIPGNIAYDPDYFYVQIDSSHLGVPVSLYIQDLVGKYIKGETSGVTALVINYILDSQSDNNNYTLYVKYQSSSDTDFVTNSFISGENLIILEDLKYSLSTIRNGSTFSTTIVRDAVGSGSAAKIEQGVYFMRGFFVDVESQTVILDQYDNSPSYRIGLDITESIAVASQNNPDLYDNARGFSNFAAPGADRFKLTATLIVKSLDDFNDENFVELLRVENGILQKFAEKQKDFNMIRDELARRTYDESGDYYVTPFKINVKESLNNKIGNNGIFTQDQITQQGNIPSEDLLSLQISPGKAYVRGYEVETINTLSVDLQKPRTTEPVINDSIQFSLGKQFELNNVYGSVNVGFGTTSQVKFYSDRTSTPGSSSGLEIGIGRIYDLKLKNSQYSNSATKFEASFYDIQTYVYLNLNTTITITAPSFIVGKNSGASGYLVSNVSSSNQLRLYQTSGSFSVNESITINGVDANRTISSVRDYSISDIDQIVSTSGGFSADTVLSRGISLAPVGSTFTITSGSGGISTVTTSSSNFYVGINTGDIVSYTKSGQILPTYNRVKSVIASSNSITIEAITSIVGVNSGGLPTSTITSTDFIKVTPEILNLNQAYLFAKLNNTHVSNTDLTGSDIIIRKSYPITVSLGGASATLETNTDFTLEPFDEEDYNLTFTSTGVVESLNNQKLTIGTRSVTLQNISANGSAILTVTWKKRNLKAKTKIFSRASTLVVSRSSQVSSGIGTTTTNDGLTYSNLYGTRVQDKEICLNVPDVQNILAVYESNDENDPDLPKLVLTGLNANIINVITGEYFYGVNSNAVGILVSNNGTNQIEFVYSNENSFQEGEKIIFRDSGVTGIVESFIEGDRDILSDYILNAGQKLEYADYSYIIRKDNSAPPTKRIKVVFNNYILDPNDSGDFVTVDSYDKQRYSSELPKIDIFAASDIVDLRPRVTPYDPATSTRSPFEFDSRSFDVSRNSTPYNFAKDKSLNLSYNYYVGRIDKLYLNKDGRFFINSGVPSNNPKTPSSLDNALEVSTIVLSPYIYSTSDVRVIMSPHKRYRMRDISNIDDRLKNVEYYTSLSLLESDTKNLTLKDSQTGLDRFKSGFFVDNFKSIYSGSITDPAYRCSIDTTEGHLRPQHYTTSIDLLLGSEAVIGIGNTSNPDADLRFVTNLGNPNTKRVGDIVCLNYTDKVFLKNDFATRSENVNPFAVVNWIGAIELNPTTDTWIETKTSRRTEDVEGSYNSMVQALGVDTNTGLSPIDWGAWETTWTGTEVTGRQSMGRIFVGTEQVSQSTSRGGFQKGRGVPETTTTTFKDQFTNFTNVTTLTTTSQSRQGIQYKVGERFDEVTLGPRVVSTDVIHTMRSRNIEFISRRLKPNTKVYPFFDNVDMSQYTVPKLIEVSMVSGTFTIGETVTGTLGSVSVRFRLAKANHKYGPYNNPTQIYSQNPYNTSESVPTSYSTTSTILNVDTASLELQSASGYYGYIVKNMRLVGSNSGAIAQVNNVRLISDKAGTLIGSLFIPDSKLPSTPSFETGTKTFTLTTSSTNSTIAGTTDSSAETNFTSAGTLNNVEDVTLRIRNAEVARQIKTDTRTLQETNTQLVASTSFANRTTTQTRWVDPLAQSFEVPDSNGVFITKCDVFFKSKDTNGLPVTMQIRTMQTGLPTQTILPFGEVVLEPDDVNISEDASAATTFTFPSPVYLETGNSYCVVLLSASNSYNVWISRMGEEDISTINLAESEKILVSQQPLLGSLFKSQNGATWDPSQLEDLKLRLYRAEFYTGSSNVRFYNPTLDLGNNQIATLQPNPLVTSSKSILVGIAKSFTSSEISNLQPGVSVLQYSNINFRSKLKSLAGAIQIGGVLTISAAGFGFTSSSRTYSNVDLITLTGKGSGGKVDITVNGGVAIAATVSIGGTGYAYGDTLEVNYTQTDGFGNNLILTIPNQVGIISAFNSLILEGVQGQINQNNTDNLIYVGTGGTSVLSGATVKYVETLVDGLHFQVKHKNHGMYASNDYVKLFGMQSDYRPQKITADYTSSSTSSIPLETVGIFTSFENITVSALNPGYILLGDEIIRYTGVTTSTNVLTGITRGIDSTIPSFHSKSTLAFKYELNGVSLRRINKTHSIAETDKNTYPTDLDHYYIKVDMSNSGTNRNTGNPNSFPELFFNANKTCGSYDPLSFTNSFRTPKATQNIPFNVIRPNITTLIPQATSISAKIRTFSGGSPDNNELSPFIDQGFEDISLTSNNFLSSPRIICSQVNENQYLTSYPGKKSLTMEMTLTTTDSKVSPMIDLDRVSLITIGNRMNSKVANYATDSRVNSLRNDPTASSYVTKIVKLERAADNLKVFFDSYRHASSDIRVLYRLFRSDSEYSTQLYELFPGYDNLDVNGDVIDPANNNGRPDKNVTPSSTIGEFKSYEFTAKNLPQFNGFQIKILMSGTNTTFTPLIKDLRVIASI